LRAAQNAGYLSYSEAYFEGFRPAGATRFMDGDTPNFTPIGATIRVYDPKTEIFTDI